jgi:hypothetical protein
VSLRGFHLLFIGLSVVLAAFVGAWAVGEFRLEHEAQYAVTVVSAVLTGGGLAIYGARFQRKSRGLVRH